MSNEWQDKPLNNGIIRIDICDLDKTIWKHGIVHLAASGCYFRAFGTSFFHDDQEVKSDRVDGFFMDNRTGRGGEGNFVEEKRDAELCEEQNHEPCSMWEITRMVVLAT